MSRWFRWHEGTCEDGKFRVVARNAEVTVATVTGVWAMLLEDASHVEHRGVATRGEDFYAAILDLSAQELQHILEKMDDIGLISVGHGNITITKWKERQFETDAVDGTNAKRQQRFREKQKANGKQTPRNSSQPLRNGSVTAAKRPDTDTEADTEADKISEANASGANAPDDPRKRLFNEGLKTIARLTGKGPDACRSFVGKCLKAASDDAVTVLGLIEDAERNQVVDPSAWIAARLKPTETGYGKPKSAIIQAADDLCERLASFEGPPRAAGPGDGLRSGAGQTVVRLLPHRRGE